MFEIIGKTIVSIFTLFAHFLTPTSGFTTAHVDELFSIWNTKVSNMDIVVILQAVIFIFTLLKNRNHKLFTAGGLAVLLQVFLYTLCLEFLNLVYLDSLSSNYLNLKNQNIRLKEVRLLAKQY